MALLMRFENVNDPIGPTDVQIHKTSPENTIVHMVADAVSEAAQTYPGKRYNGYTYEIVADGAGVKHYNVTVHFKSDEPTLNPRNLNEAPQQMFGQVLDEVELERRGIGRSDTRIGSPAPTSTLVDAFSPSGELGKLQASVPSAVDGKR